MNRLPLIKLAIRTMRLYALSRKYEVTRQRLNKLASLKPLPRQCRVTPVDAGGVPAEWVSWEGEDDSDRVILYLHGGGYVICSPTTHRPLALRFARSCRGRALLIDYRLAPEEPHPAALEDAVAAYRWLLGSGIKPSRIVIIGDSAGGGLTLATLQYLRDKRIPLPSCAVCLSPWTDLDCCGGSLDDPAIGEPMLPRTFVRRYAGLYAGFIDRRDPYVSPLYGNFAKLPPILVHVGTDEVLLDDSRRLKRKADAEGADIELEIWPEMFHVFQAVWSLVPDAMRSVEKITAFICRHIPPAGERPAPAAKRAAVKKAPATKKTVKKAVKKTGSRPRKK